MKHSSASSSRLARSRRPVWYRPVVESLERRLPPGDVLWTLLLGGSELALGMDADEIENNGMAFIPAEKPELGHVVFRTASGAKGVSEGIAAHEHENRHDDSTPDPVNQQMAPAPTFSRPNTAAVNLTPVTGASFAGLATPSQRNTLSPVTPGRVQLGARYLANGPSAPQAPNPETPSEASQSEILDNYGKLPLSFEQNVGQFDDRVDFVSRAGGGTVFLTPTAAVFSMQNSESRVQNSETHEFLNGGRQSPEAASVRGLTPSAQNEMGGVAVYMNIVGGNANAHPTSSNQQPGITNYFIGNNPNEWHTDIASFGRVEYDDVYPGIDLAYYGNNNQLEYDFIVSPGADPNAIALNFAGADGVEVNPQGDLVVHSAVGDVVQQKPFTYQDVGNTRREVTSGYVVEGDTVRFDVGHYDPSRPLVIDPVVLGYSTFLGGSPDDSAIGIAVDSSGNAYVTGRTESSTFPTKPGSFDTGFNSGGDVYVSKINGAGTGLMYSTFIGGSVTDVGYALAVDGSGNAYVTGTTVSTNFPVTGFSFDTSHNGSSDVFVAKLNPFGSGLDYSTFLGGSNSESGTAIAINNNSEAFVTGVTESANFPTTPGAFDTTLNNSEGVGDAFVTKVTLISSVFDLDYSTFLGGLEVDHGTGIAVDASQNAYVSGYTISSNFPTTSGAFDTTMSGGYDTVITKLNATGSALLYSTYLGGIGSDVGNALDIDVSGNAYITGHTSSGDFPVTSGAFDTSKSGIYDSYVFKLNAAGSAPVYSTYLGGTQDESGYDLRVDAAGNAFVAGFTNSSNFPSTPDAFDKIFNAFSDAYVTRLNAAGSALVYSTFLGGLANETAYGVAVDGKGGIYVTGDTTSSDFPTSPTAFDTTHGAGGSEDVFVTKLHAIPAPCGCFNAQTISTTANGAYDVFAADIDRDGDTDVLSASFYDNKIAWYENTGNESFTARTISTSAMGAKSVFAADIDGDGDTDVLSASGLDNKVAWYRNNGSQSFTPFTISSTAMGAQSVYAADVDRDGDVDALSASQFDSKIAWYENNGTGSFTTRVISTAANGAIAVVTADLDNDGDIDVLSASNGDAKIAWYKNNGSQVFTAQTITTAAPNAMSVAAADVNGDGYTDVLFASAGDNKIAWYENIGGSGVFTAHTITTALDVPTDVFAADINADGKTDVLSASYFDNKIAWYKNGGGSNPSFTPHTITTNANLARAVIATDVDRDGDLDALSASFGDDKIAWYENLPLFDVSNTNDSGPGSLRQAILDSNAIPGVDTITFSLAAGVQTITPTTALPTITDPVIIDGTTKIDYAGTPLVVLSGANITTQSGLHVTAGNSTIKGLVINGFTFGVAIRLETAGGNVVTGNYLGTDAAGTTAVKNNIGVYVLSNSNTVGGTTAASRNLISGNGSGVFVAGNSNVIQGNFIGTNAAGTAALANLAGVNLVGNGNLVGGTVAGAGNRIAFNVAEGIVVDSGDNNAIRQNAMYSNGGVGIDQVNGGNNNQITPKVTRAVSSGGTTKVWLSLMSAPNTTFSIDVFSNAACDPTGFGEGEVFLGTTSLTTGSTGSGSTSAIFGVEVPAGHVITATATSPANDTSEFAKCQSLLAKAPALVHPIP